MKDLLDYPFDPAQLLRKKRALRRTLSAQEALPEQRIAILGGSTTAEVRDMLELFLLHGGIRPLFYESQYNQYAEEALFANPALDAFCPDIVYIHTSSVNVSHYPALTADAAAVAQALDAQFERFRAIWTRLKETYGCVVIQNNFEAPHSRPLGNLDGTDLHGRTHTINELNRRFAEYARAHEGFYINDIHYLAAWFGLARWYDRKLWHAYKYAMSLDAIPYLAHGLASQIKALRGHSKKCLVLDLDNTLWGGVIGDDGLGGIHIGPASALGEAHAELQTYLKALKERGVMLAVCSKNETATAEQGFSHPDSVLHRDDFAAFAANWERKDSNLQALAAQLNIGLDSLVFLDDNPVERELVANALPAVAVPNIGSDAAEFVGILDRAGLFELPRLAAEDMQRHRYYADNAQRTQQAGEFEDYDAFLRSLAMQAEIKPFAPLYLERITQLCNKTNQFNLTTRRYTQPDIAAIAVSPAHIALYGRLKDKFGDNGLIAVVIAALDQRELHIDAWLMSCRVLKRGMEYALFECLLQAAKTRGVEWIYGYYYPSPKNGMVSTLYRELGFEPLALTANGDSTWRYDCRRQNPTTHCIEMAP